MSDSANGGNSGSNHFELSSQQCQLLMELERSQSLAELAKVFSRDPSVLSRQIKHIHSLAPVVEKRGGNWALTSLGIELVRWAKEASACQQSILKGSQNIRIGAASEFAMTAVSFALSLSSVASPSPTLYIEPYPEKSLLQGTVDIVFGTGLPRDSKVHYHLIGTQYLCCVASPRLMVQNVSGLSKYPLIQWALRPFPENLRKLNSPVALICNDIGAIKTLCRQGMGWSILPQSAVKAEIRNGTLKEICRIPSDETITVSWIRNDSRQILQCVEAACSWLKNQEKLL